MVSKTATLAPLSAFFPSVHAFRTVYSKHGTGVAEAEHERTLENPAPEHPPE